MASTVIPLRQAAVESSLKRAAFDYAGVAMLCVNGTGQILALNSEASDLVGGDSPIGRSVAEIVPSQVIEHSRAAGTGCGLSLRVARTQALKPSFLCAAVGA